MTSAPSNSLPIAAMFPDCKFILVDTKKAALDLAIERAKASGLENVETREMLLEQFSEDFDIAIAVHLCGQASDLANYTSSGDRRFMSWCLVVLGTSSIPCRSWRMLMC